MKLEEEGFDAWSRTRLIHMLESACGLGHTEETDTLWCQLTNGRLVPVVWSYGREVISQIKTTKFPGRNCTVSTCLYKVRGNFIIQQVLELSHHSNWLISVSYTDSAVQVKLNYNASFWTRCPTDYGLSADQSCWCNCALGHLFHLHVHLRAGFHLLLFTRGTPLWHTVHGPATMDNICTALWRWYHCCSFTLQQVL